MAVDCYLHTRPCSARDRSLTLESVSRLTFRNDLRALLALTLVLRMKWRSATQVVILDTGLSVRLF
jgi:hypothetical protein